MYETDNIGFELAEAFDLAAQMAWPDNEPKDVETFV